MRNKEKVSFEIETFASAAAAFVSFYSCPAFEETKKKPAKKKHSQKRKRASRNTGKNLIEFRQRIFFSSVSRKEVHHALERIFLS